MGATMPAIAGWVETTPSGVSWLGFFYGGNTAGAVFGCLLAGFYLLRVYDMPTTTYVAVAINITVALLALVLSRVAKYEAPRGDETAVVPRLIPPGAGPVYLTIALSGMCALGAEVVWTRLLSLMIGGTTYTFSIILAVFLIGIGLGSSVGSVVARSVARPRVALGICQFLVVLAVAWSAMTIAKALPYWPVNPGLASSPWFNFQLDLVRCMVAILPAATLWGASFPLALAAVATDGQDGGYLVGGVYAANTVGAIAGALAFSIVFIPVVGTQDAQRVLAALACIAAFVMLVPVVLGRPEGGQCGADRRRGVCGGVGAQRGGRRAAHLECRGRPV